MKKGKGKLPIRSKVSGIKMQEVKKIDTDKRNSGVEITKSNNNELSKPKNKGGRPRRNVPTKTKQIIDLATKHKTMSIREIADTVQCHHTNVLQTLERYGIDKEKAEHYKKHEAEILADARRRLVAIKLTDTAMQKMPDNIAPLWFNSLFNNQRLLEDKSTQNVSMSAMLHEVVQKLENVNEVIEVLEGSSEAENES